MYYFIINETCINSLCLFEILFIHNSVSFNKYCDVIE